MSGPKGPAAKRQPAQDKARQQTIIVCSFAGLRCEDRHEISLAPNKYVGAFDEEWMVGSSCNYIRGRNLLTDCFGNRASSIH